MKLEPPLCPVQSTCGGCPSLHLSQAEEQANKLETVRAALHTVGIDVAGIDGRETLPTLRMVPTDSRVGYRNRMRLQVVDGRADFFNDAKRDGCLVVRPDLWAGIEKLRRLTAGEPELLAHVSHLEVRVGDATPPEPNLALALSYPEQAHQRQRTCSALRDRLGPEWLVADSAMDHPPSLPYIVTSNGARVMVPVTSFVQVNAAVNRQLVEAVVAVADDTLATSFLDLFSGAGNFAVPLATADRTGIAIDSSPEAIAELQRFDPSRIIAIVGDARTELAALAPADFVVIDPPRAGIQTGYDAIANRCSKTLVLVSCRASSCATDVAELQQRGLMLQSVTAFNMFPGTKHIETMAVLSR